MTQPSPALRKHLSSARQSPSISLEPATQLLCRLAAAHAGQLDAQWINQILRLAATHALPEHVRRNVFESEAHGMRVEFCVPAIDADVARAPNNLLPDFYVYPLLEHQMDILQQLEEPRVQSTISKKWTHSLMAAPFTAPPTSRDSDAEKAQWMKKLQQSGPTREIAPVTPKMLRDVSDLKERAPHLAAATDLVLRSLRLQLRGSRHLQFPPILLVGEPGCGKSWWAQELATAIGVSQYMNSMPTVTASFEITGASTGWMSAKPGFILRHFVETPCATPLFILDEIDKMTQGNYDPRPSLLGLLEQSTAKRFRDEFFDLEFDVSKSLFVATANSTLEMSGPLLNRFTVVHVPMPTRDQRRPIIDAVWSSLRKERADLRLPQRLSEEVVDHLVGQFNSVRALGKLLMNALGEAARRNGRLQLTRFDFK